MTVAKTGSAAGFDQPHLAGNLPVPAIYIPADVQLEQPHLTLLLQRQHRVNDIRPPESPVCLKAKHGQPCQTQSCSMHH